MIYISPYSPLFFSPSKDATGNGSSYVQTFAKTDHVLLELIAGTSDEIPSVVLRDEVTGTDTAITMETWQMNPDTVVYYYVFTLLATSYYSVSVNGMKSEVFFVTDNEMDLENTVLIQYSNKDNRHLHDVVFFIGQAQMFFDFRVPGGFKDNGWTFMCDSEQFVTPEADIVQISAIPSTQRILTVGFQMGCPIWFGELLNRLFCCDYIYVDGERVCRKESSAPEIAEVMEGSRSFVFRQATQKVTKLDETIEKANKAIYRRANSDMRTVNANERLRIL